MGLRVCYYLIIFREYTQLNLAEKFIDHSTEETGLVSK